MEPDFPFFSQTVDARDFGEAPLADNLTPRGIVLNLGAGVHACFDTDLLRYSLIWKEAAEGEVLTMTGMGPGSYREPSRKAPSGQNKLPKPLGTPLVATYALPGVGTGEKGLAERDPRDVVEPGIDREVGLGPLPIEMGKWQGIYLTGNGSLLAYKIGKTEVLEHAGAVKGGAEGAVLVRLLKVEPHEEPLWLRLGPGEMGDVSISGGEAVKTEGKAGDLACRIDPAKDSKLVRILMALGDAKGTPFPEFKLAAPDKDKPFPALWNEPVTTTAQIAEDSDAYVVDTIPIPVPNPWKRNVRLSGLDFFSDGRAVLITFDGDVWLVEGLGEDLKEVTWRRFASGLHEPMGMRVVDDQIYVSGRNGITRLHDRDGNGEADFYENFSSVVAQTAETREFAMDMMEKPGGGFYLSKGGQIGTRIGKYNGTIMEVSADGQSFKVIGSGLRQPFSGVDPLTGMITSSDQQGNWVPATPVHVIEEGHHYGFLPEILKNPIHPKPISEPPVWIPHFVNQSGASQVFLRNAKMGPLNDSLIHIGFNRPEIFKVYFDESGKTRQGAVAPITADFKAGLLHGEVGPKDGQLYLTGFKIWGTVASEISGLYRLRYTGKPSYLPEDVRSFDKGILLKFGEPLEESIATSLMSYSVDRWTYRRTADYGSGHYKPNGEPGQEALPVANAYLSEDKKSVFLAIPDMQVVEQMRVTYRLARESDKPEIKGAYLTVRELHPVDMKALGFGDTEIDLTVKEVPGLTMNHPDPSAEEGQKVYQLFGCMACHTTDGSKAQTVSNEQAVGPTWKNLWGSKREFTDGTVVKKVDEVYLRESILDPGRKVVAGFGELGEGMPSYLGVLQDYQIDSLILFIKSLEGDEGGKKKKKG